MIVARMPPLHARGGNVVKSPESHGAPPFPFTSPGPLQRWQIPGNVPVLLRSPGFPATIRNPFLFLYSLERRPR